MKKTITLMTVFLIFTTIISCSPVSHLTSGKEERHEAGNGTEARIRKALRDMGYDVKAESQGYSKLFNSMDKKWDVLEKKFEAVSDGNRKMCPKGRVLIKIEFSELYGVVNSDNLPEITLNTHDESKKTLSSYRKSDPATMIGRVLTIMTQMFDAKGYAGCHEGSGAKLQFSSGLHDIMLASDKNFNLLASSIEAINSFLESNKKNIKEMYVGRDRGNDYDESAGSFTISVESKAFPEIVKVMKKKRYFFSGFSELKKVVEQNKGK